MNDKGSSTEVAPPAAAATGVNPIVAAAGAEKSYGIDNDDEEVASSSAGAVGSSTVGTTSGDGVFVDVDVESSIGSIKIRRIRDWRESPFAVGPTKQTWEDEEMDCGKLCYSCCTCSSTSCVDFTACVCACLGAGRVGNMVILAQDTEEIQDPLSGQTVLRPRLRWVVGPYWTVVLLLTVPALTCLSVLVAWKKLPDRTWPIVLVFVLLTGCVYLSLFLVSCSDPGIMYRYPSPPEGVESEWRWSDQALTYRPWHAKYDQDCAVVVQYHDHTCPWTGTAIGQNNLKWFQMFKFSLLLAVIFDLVVLLKQ